MLAINVYVHFSGPSARRRSLLFEMTGRGMLGLGRPVPSQYTVHRCELSEKEDSVNLLLTNHGGPIDLELIRQYVIKYWGNQNSEGSGIQVGTFES